MLRYFQDLSLNRKLAAIIMLTTVATILFSALAIVSYQFHTFTRLIISELETTAAMLGANGAVALRFNVPRDAEHTLATLEAKKNISSAAFFNVSEQVFAKYSRDGVAIPEVERPLNEGHTFAFTENYINLIKHVYQDGDLIGTVLVHSDLDALYKQLLQAIAATFIIVLCSSCLALWLAVKWLRVISLPITKLADLALRVSKDRDYTLRAEKFANDELGILTDEFNDMLQQIELRDADLQQEIGERKQAEKFLEKVYTEREQHIVEQVKTRTNELQTANENLHREINERQQAEAASRTKSAFLANMSHEFRTPMTAIIGITSLVLQGNLNATHRSYMRLVEESAESLLLLLNDVLDFSKIEADELVLENIPFSLYNTLVSTVRGLSLKAHEKGLELPYRISDDVPDQLIGDPIRLRQIIVNLIGNAIKFTDQGQASLVVGVEELTADKVYLRFAVSDTGIGISTEDYVHIFDAFSQADVSTTRQYGGTGLGLGISKQLVEMMGGYMAVESVVGEGSTFHFSIWLNLQQGVVQSINQVIGSSLPDKRVLVVDDNETSRQVVQELLLPLGPSVIAVDSGMAALKALEAAGDDKQYDAVIVDSYMPGMNGIELISRINVQSFSSDLRLIMLTMAGHPEQDLHSTELNVDYYLDKPLGRIELYDALHHVFGTVLEEDKDVAVLQESPVIQPLMILIAEDTIANQHLVEAVLTQRGHQVVLVDNGKEAVEAYGDIFFDLVLMDAQMPVMDGFDATTRIRALEEERGTHTPIIALTARAIKGDKERCLEAGMDGYLSKPFKPEELLEAIDHCLVDLDEKNKYKVSKKNENMGDMTKESVLTFLGGDHALLVEITALIKDSYPGLLAEVEQAIQRQDLSVVESKAHALKGTFGVIGINAAQDAAQYLENEANRGEWSRLNELVQHCKTEAEYLITNLENFASEDLLEQLS